MQNKEKIINYVLIALIIISIFLRFYGLKEEYLWDDEKLSMISAIKIHTQDLKSGIMYFQEHPGLGKWLVALPVNFISADYAPINALGPNMFAWAFIAYDAVAANYYPIRLMNALIGTLAILFAYLIIRKLFSKEAALWTAAVIAVSPDMIAYSRHEVLMKIIAISAVIASIYFYIRYITEKVQDKRWLYLGITIIILTFAIGSRNFDPLFIIPALIISQFLINSGKENLKENLIVSGLIIASFLFVFYYTYPPEAKAFAQQHLQAQSPLQLVGFTFHNMIYMALIRNSYMFSISFILIMISLLLYLTNRKKPDEGSCFVNALKFLKTKEPKAVLTVFFLVSLLGIGFTRLGSGSMYNITFYTSIFLLSGIFIVKLIKKYSNIKYIFATILVINLILIIPNFPYSTWDYSNLNIGSGFYENKLDKEVPDAVLNELKLRGNPSVDTSLLNILMFYEGKKTAMVLPGESRCKEDYFRALLSSKPLIIHKEKIENDQYICQFYKQLPLKEVKNIDNAAFIYEIKNDI